MKTTPKVSKDPNDGPLVVDVVCNPGYLLVPAEASRLHCINDTWNDLPDCKGGLCWLLREREKEEGEREGGRERRRRERGREGEREGGEERGRER